MLISQYISLSISPIPSKRLVPSMPAMLAMLLESFVSVFWYVPKNISHFLVNSSNALRSVGVIPGGNALGGGLGNRPCSLVKLDC